MCFWQKKIGNLCEKFRQVLDLLILSLLHFFQGSKYPLASPLLQEAPYKVVKSEDKLPDHKRMHTKQPLCNFRAKATNSTKKARSYHYHYLPSREAKYNFRVKKWWAKNFHCISGGASGGMEQIKLITLIVIDFTTRPQKIGAWKDTRLVVFARPYHAHWEKFEMNVIKCFKA